MQATLSGHVIAASDDVLEFDNYRYFRHADVRMEWLEPADKTESDRACPHGVRFYDVVIDGIRHQRMAWSYEAPNASLQHIAERIGFWKEVDVR